MKREKSFWSESGFKRIRIDKSSSLQMNCQCPNERFSENNLTLMKAIDALCPKSDSFLSVVKLEPFLHHYSACLPLLDNVDSEISTFKNYLSKNPIPDDDSGSRGLHGLLECINPVQMTFPILCACFQIALTLGTSTASLNVVFLVFVTLRHTCVPL